MSVISMKQLLEAGVHFGHQTRRWNPKMEEYIFTERNGIYIIDLQKTVKKVEEAYNAMKDIISEGGAALSIISFVATDCTLPALSPFLTFFQRSGLILYPTNLSKPCPIPAILRICRHR